MSNTLIQFDDVTKWFRRVPPGRGLKDRLLGARRDAAKRTQALTGVSLSVRRGEAIAVIGRNGSGKSTCLALAAGVIKPSLGRVAIRARVSPLLALGAGVHPDLTGRENVQLNGVLLGMTRREVRARFESIHDFSELGDFIDQPVRHYSSGMLARLAFSVATHLEPEVLIVDEVLAVGDAAFAEKCFQRIAQARADGLTMLYVSHDIDTVLRLCDRAIYLDTGRVVAEGDPLALCRRYYEDQGLTLPAEAHAASSG
ncbi:MAG: ABC transporter ATP-binding protein [Planctomycetota bacterium]